MPSPAHDPSLPLLLGVDAGGSKTRATLARLVKGDRIVLLGAGVSGPGNPLSVGFSAATAAIEKAIDEARASARGVQRGVDCATIAVAGAANEHSAQQLTSWAANRSIGAVVDVVPDTAPLLAAAQPSGPALGLVSGTGSVAVARPEPGRVFRAGGWGFLLGDEGSGYDIGRDAIRAVLGEPDEQGAPTALRECVLGQFDAASTGALLRQVYVSENPRAAIAALARPVLELAAGGDKSCVRIARRAAQALAGTLLDAARRADMAHTRAPLAISGSVLVHSRLIRDAVLERLAEAGAPIEAHTVIADLSHGALRLAARRLGVVEAVEISAAP